MQVEYIPKDPEITVEGPVHFCHSRVETEEELHTKVKLLHCDLNPDNVRRSDGVVGHIDLEPAKRIDSAQRVRGIVRFWSAGNRVE